MVRGVLPFSLLSELSTLYQFVLLSHFCDKGVLVSSLKAGHFTLSDGAELTERTSVSRTFWQLHQFHVLSELKVPDNCA